MLFRALLKMVAPIDWVILRLSNYQYEDYLWGKLKAFEVESKGVKAKYTTDFGKEFEGYYYNGWMSTPQWLICADENKIVVLE